jgi:hypothetical protein
MSVCKIKTRVSFKKSPDGCANLVIEFSNTSNTTGGCLYRPIPYDHPLNIKKDDNFSSLIYDDVPLYEWPICTPSKHDYQIYLVNERGRYEMRISTYINTKSERHDVNIAYPKYFRFAWYELIRKGFKPVGNLNMDTIVQ